MAYTHGIYADIIETTDAFSKQGIGTIPCYVGFAPVNQLLSADRAAVTNVPILIRSLAEFKATFGWVDADDWISSSVFNLCEAAYVHFSGKNAGPIICINALDAVAMKKSQQQTTSVTFTNKIGYIAKENVLIDTITITDKIEGTDFSVSLSDDGSQIKITDLTTIGASASVKYYEVDTSLLVKAAIIGSVTDDTKIGIQAIDYIYAMLGVVPSLLSALDFGTDLDVVGALLDKSYNLNGHWNANVFCDIDSSSNKTTAAALTAKDTFVSDKNAKVFFPAATIAGKKVLLSTVAIATKQLTDLGADNVPFNSASNKKLSIDSAIVDALTQVYYDETQANALNEKGITTAIFRGGNWVSWGPHMSNFDYSNIDNIDPAEILDSSVFMLNWYKNGFQTRNANYVDQPMDRRTVDTIINGEKIFGQSLVAEGKLLSFDISFNVINNPDSAIVEGDFVFDLGITTTPTAKTITGNIQWTADGLSTYATTLTGGVNV